MTKNGFNSKCFSPIIACLCLFLTLTIATAQEPHVRVAHWHPFENKIAVTDGYKIEFYTDGFEYIDEIRLNDPEDVEVGLIQMKWSPDGNLLAIARYLWGIGANLQIWGVLPRHLVAEVNEDTLLMLPIFWNSDSIKLATAGAVGLGEERVFIYDAQTGNHIIELVPPPPVNISQLAWSADDSQIVIGTIEGLEIWDVSSQSPMVSPPLLPRSYTGVEVAFSPRSNHLAFVNSQTPDDIQIWDTDSKQQLRTLQGHTDTIEYITWGSGGIISVDSEGTTRVWNPDTGELISAIQVEPIFPPQWSPDGTKFVVTDDKLGVHIRNAVTGDIKAVLGETPTINAN